MLYCVIGDVCLHPWSCGGVVVCVGCHNFLSMQCGVGWIGVGVWILRCVWLCVQRLCVLLFCGVCQGIYSSFCGGLCVSAPVVSDGYCRVVSVVSVE